MRRGKRSPVMGDRSIATPKPGPRCAALRVLVGTSADGTGGLARIPNSEVGFRGWD